MSWFSLLPLLLGVPAESQSLPAVIHPSANPGIASPGFISNPSNPGVATRRDRDGMFRFGVEVNGTVLPMVFDSGASFVKLRYEDASKVGIDPEGLSFTTQTNTANGVAYSARVTIPAMTVGGITRRNVAALIGKPGLNSVNLLGQSFLARIGGFRQEGNLLILLDGG